jgi:hypothetical protein
MGFCTGVFSLCQGFPYSRKGLLGGKITIPGSWSETVSMFSNGLQILRLESRFLKWAMPNFDFHSVSQVSNEGFPHDGGMGNVVPPYISALGKPCLQFQGSF